MKFERYAISRIVDESGDVRTFRLQKKDGSPLPQYQPGKFFLLRLQDPSGKMVQRAYSAASHPSEPFLAFCIKLKGAFTHMLWGLKEGDSIEVDGPYGIFLLKPEDASRVFIGGGVGISALRSMVMQTIKEGKPCALFHSARHIEDLIYFSQMQKLSEENKGFSFYPTLTGDEAPAGWGGLRGRISVELMAGKLGSLEGKAFYLCGSKEMTSQLSDALMAAGVPKEMIRKDEWG